MSAKLILLNVASLLLGIALWLGWQYAFKQDYSVNLLDSQDGCLLDQSPCQVSDGSKKVALSMQPRPVHLMQDIDVALTLENITLSSDPYLLIEGDTMEMGFQRAMLVASDSTPQSLYAGKTVLPVCTEEEMRWRVTVTLPTEDGMIYARFYLETQR